MANPRQKRKRLSSRSLVRQKPKSKRLAIKSNPIIAKNWDRKATLSQNYQRLGLTAKLNGTTGGVERKKADVIAEGGEGERRRQDGLALGATEKGLGSVRVIRDEDGKIIQVVREGEREKLAGDLLDDTSDEDVEVKTKDTEVVRQLEEQSRMVPRRRKRKMGRGEREWIERLVERWGDDFEGMSRDKSLNPMLNSPSDLKKKVRIRREVIGEKADDSMELG